MLGLAIVSLLSLALLDGGGRLSARLLRDATASARLLGGAVLGASFLLLLLLGLGQLGRIRPNAVLAGVAAFWIVGWRAGAAWSLLVPGKRVLAMPLPRRGDFVLAIGTWFVVLGCGYLLFAGLLRPYADYDALSYHLPFTASVLDTGHIPFLDTPFGDSAQAYQPKNDDLLRAAVAPFRDDERFLWMGAYPHLPLLLLSIYVLARRLGCGRRAATWGAATALIAPEILEQARGAMADLPLASWWLAFAALVLQRTRQSIGASAFVAGLALGLAYGTKYLAVPFTPLLALVLLPAWIRWGRGDRVRCLALLGLGVALTGSYFYVRNLIMTGNPLYPVKLELFGVRLLDGNYGQAVMRNWVFNLSGNEAESLWSRVLLSVGELTGLLPDHEKTFEFAHGRWILAAPIALWSLGLLASLRRGAGVLLLLIAPAVLAICWWVIPYTYSRFAILAFAMIGVAAGRAGQIPFVGYLVPVILAAHMYLTRDQQTGPLVAFASALGIVVFTWRFRRYLGRIVLWAVPLFGAGLLAVVAVHQRPLWADQPPFPESWRAMQDLAGAGPVAYAGNNLPYPLRGAKARSVVYVPLDGRTDLAFHDRARAWHADGLPPAVCPEPGFYRRHQDPKAWLTALRELRVDYLFVSRLTAWQLLIIRHDAHGFPVEDTWARAMAPVFELVYENDDEGVRIYSVHRDREPAAPLPATVERREPDAFSLRNRPADLARWYPRGVEEIEDARYARMR